MKLLSTSAKPIGYYVSLPEELEEQFGPYFENLDSRGELYTLLHTISTFMVYHSYNDDPDYSLFDAYMDSTGSISMDLEHQLGAIEALPGDNLARLGQALLANIISTQFVD